MLGLGVLLYIFFILFIQTKLTKLGYVFFFIDVFRNGLEREEMNKMINLDNPTWSSENSFVTKGSSKENLVANRINSWKEKFEFRKCLKFKMDSCYCSAE